MDDPDFAAANEFLMSEYDESQMCDQFEADLARFIDRDLQGKLNLVADLTGMRSDPQAWDPMGVADKVWEALVAEVVAFHAFHGFGTMPASAEGQQ